MLPNELKNMFGLKDTKDLNMANNIWKMLDDLAESEPQQYKKFVSKNLEEGMLDAQHKKQLKEKPFKLIPMKGFFLSMNGVLNEKPLESTINEKVLVTKQPWGEVKAKFVNDIRIHLSVTHCDRVKDATSKKTGKNIQKYCVKDLKDIQLFYYSLQGPLKSDKEQNTYQYCMILNSKFYNSLFSQTGGKKVLMSLCVSYLQERLSLDKNPLLSLYNPDQFRRLAFYRIDLYSLEINEKPYFYNGENQPQQFLLQKQIDTKRQEQQKEKKQTNQAKIEPKKQQIKFKQQKVQQSIVKEILVDKSSAPPKKILIEVLKEQETQKNDEISYNMKETQSSYHFDFLLPGILSIKEADLQMKQDCIRLKVPNKKQLIITLKKKINQDTVKAKFKKAESTLRVQAKFN